MRTIQRETGTGVVIEHRARPQVAGMATRTFVAQRAGMNVILSVATRTVCGRIMESVGFVTGGAGHRRVHTRQREARQVMIERNGRRPGRLLVASTTVLAHLSGVTVSELVTATTGCRQGDAGVVLVASSTMEF